MPAETPSEGASMDGALMVDCLKGVGCGKYSILSNDCESKSIPSGGWSVFKIKFDAVIIFLKQVGSPQKGHMIGSITNPPPSSLMTAQPSGKNKSLLLFCTHVIIFTETSFCNIAWFSNEIDKNV